MRSEVRGFHVIANGIRLHLLEYNGGRPPILILPGITSPAITWGFVAEQLAPAHTVFVLDSRGRGLSENRPGLGFTLQDYALDALGVMDCLDLEKPVILGHSMGARTAVRLGALAPERISRLILADPPLSGPGRVTYARSADSYLDAMREAGDNADVDEFRKKYHPNWTREQVALRLEWLPTCTEEAVLESLENMKKEDIFSDFAKISCPTLLIYAGNAAIISDEAAQEVVGLLADGRAMRVDNAGHMIPFDDLKTFIDAVNGFIAS